MKILVDEMPTHPSKCLFSRAKIVLEKEPREGLTKYFLSPKTHPVGRCICNVDDRICALVAMGKCNKLDIRR